MPPKKRVQHYNPYRKSQNVMCHCGIICKKPSMVSKNTAKAHAKKKEIAEAPDSTDTGTYAYIKCTKFCIISGS